MYCRKCGNSVDTNSKFCSICGNELVPDDNVNNVLEQKELSSVTYEKCYSPKVEKQPGVPSKLLASLLSVFLVISLVLTSFSVVLGIILSKGTIQSVLSSIDFNDISVDEDKLEKYNLKSDSDNLADVIYDNIDQSKMKDTLTHREFDAIIENETVASELSKLLSKKADDAINGKNGQIISVDEIITVIKNSRDDISEEIGYELTNERINNLKNALDDKYSEMLSDYRLPRVSNYVGRFPATVIKFINSDILLIIFISIDIALIALISFLRKSYAPAMKCTGGAFISISAFYIFLSMIINNVNILKIGGRGLGAQFASLSVEIIANRILFMGLAFLAIGIGLVVGSIISKAANKFLNRI